MSSVKDFTKEMAAIHPKLVRSFNDPQISRLNLTSAQTIILIALAERKKCKVGDLAKERNVSMPTITSMTDRLVKSGHVKRQRDLHDRRKVLLSLTEKGKRVIKDISDIVGTYWEGVAKQLTKSERKSLVRIFRKIASLPGEQK